MSVRLSRQSKIAIRLPGNQIAPTARLSILQGENPLNPLFTILHMNKIKQDRRQFNSFVWIVMSGTAGEKTNEVKGKRKRVNSSLTKSEYKELKKSAEKAGMTATLFLKKACFAYMGNKYIVPSGTNRLLQEIIILLRKAGNNLNQIATKSNTFKKLSIFDAKKAKGVLNNLEEQIKTKILNPHHDNQINVPQE